MLKKLLFIISLAAISSIAQAESCPTMHDLKHNSLHGWNAYDIDNGTSITDPKSLQSFEYNTRAFALAEWAPGAPEGAAHCYYYHQNSSLDYGVAYLAKQNLVADGGYAWQNSKNQHCTLKDDNCQCRAGDATCGFVAE